MAARGCIKLSKVLLKTSLCEQNSLIHALKGLTLRRIYDCRGRYYSKCSPVSFSGYIPVNTLKKNKDRNPDEIKIEGTKQLSTSASKNGLQTLNSENMSTMNGSPVKKKNLSTAAVNTVNGTSDEELGDFDKHGLSQSIQKKLRAQGIAHLFPVQYETYDHTLAGNDVIVQARTGTGKTLSFALPLVEKIQKTQSKERGRKPRVVVLAPTRELANQVKEDFHELSDTVSVTCVYGGAPYVPQENAIRRGLDVVVGTPGRMNDLIEKGTLSLRDVEHVVLDEVDQMLDMGFQDIVEQIIKTCYEKAEKPQTMLYSATMPHWVKSTAKKYLNDSYKMINLVGQQSVKTSTTIEQLAIKCYWNERPSLVRDIVKVYSGSHGRAIVFCQTKKEADELWTGELCKESHVLHGDIKQAKREIVIKGFKSGKYKILITTDVAARGLDVPNVDLVIQTQPPMDLDNFIHRTGRTGRAGKSGVAICFYQPKEEHQLRACEHAANIKFKIISSPTAEDIIKASSSDAAKFMEKVPEKTINYFRKSAQDMIDEKGAVDSLAAAMAVITGATKIASRSLLRNAEGYTTFLFKTDVEMRGPGLARKMLTRHLDENVDVCSFTMTEDKQGVVFDVPVDYAEELEDSFSMESHFNDTLERVTELPPLEARFSGGGGYRGRGGFGRGGGYGGGRGGGRGGFGGHFNNRGSYGGQRSGRFSIDSSFRGGYKRSGNFEDDGASRNKIVKFHE